MEMHMTPYDLSSNESENSVSQTPNHHPNAAKEGIERIFQALSQAIDAADENDASLWRMWR